MEPNKAVAIMEGMVSRTLKSIYFLWPFSIISSIVLIIICYFASIEDLEIFPKTQDYNYDYYTDLENGGSSQVINHIVSDSLLTLDFKLEEGFESPYAGMIITASNKKYIDAEKYNEIQLNISGKNIDRVGVAFYTPPLSYVKYNSQDETLHHSYLNISSSPKTYSIPFTDFEHPEWWEDRHHIPEGLEEAPSFNNIIHLNINTAFTPSIDKVKAIEIRSITFTRNNQVLFLKLIAAYIITITLFFCILLWLNARKKDDSTIAISYKPIEISEEVNGEEKCIEFINQNFQNSELSLDLVAKETGIAQRRITNYINGKYNCTFKSYINKIRISEAKRLLNESKLNIGEIAYKVGFNNQSHFNRVFKSEMEINPTEYRINHH
ncbi:helix-turn-helix domain-containing protein [Chondrinema litorale]|uniref:helix-turn-helix domain-containing protein n=1 Tax=Chondrinema litorale TaxID=2994555 RepID=UPI002543BDD9|nr:AraC family transcriptional regulator [Chondrinema litorale]UZR96460.1 AraC family transcriptional regulator [Chondrinema litorale]